MTEILHEFETGPYNVLEYKIVNRNGKPVLLVNDGDLGRVEIENKETVFELRKALDELIEFFEDAERRQEEL